MTREELVKQAAQDFASSGEYAPTLTECFKKGVEWEHKRLVEKVAKWIKENTDWTEEYIWDGRNPNYGLWGELKNFLEE